MTNFTADSYQARYRGSYGWLAGYLPEHPEDLLQWRQEFLAKVEKFKAERTSEYAHDSVARMSQLIRDNAIIRMLVTEMIEQADPKYKTINSIDQMLDNLDAICITAPEYNVDKSKRVLFPMSALFVGMMATVPGKALFRNDLFNESLRAVLRQWAIYLDSAESRWVLNKNDLDGWLGANARKEFLLDQFDINWDAPFGNFSCYNAFFHRKLLPGQRPVASPKDASVIVSANDGKIYRIATDVQATGNFWIKEKNYSLRDMLLLPDGPELDKFVGGTVVQVFLSGADYHRWHAPVEGHASYRVVNGSLFSENEDPGIDPDAGVTSQVYDATVNNRILVRIDSDDERLGSVYVIPIGITEISSIEVRIKNGERVHKGDELGWFSYGGSTLCIVFEKKVRLEFESDLVAGLSQGEAPKVQVNAKLADAKFS